MLVVLTGIPWAAALLATRSTALALLFLLAAALLFGLVTTLLTGLSARLHTSDIAAGGA